MEREEFRQQIINHIDAFTRDQGRAPAEYRGGPTVTPPREMKRALEERQEELMREALLKFQTQWIEKQKAKWEKAYKSFINSAQNSPTLTTR
jgi:hypothetical protein